MVNSKPMMEISESVYRIQVLLSAYYTCMIILNWVRNVKAKKPTLWPINPRAVYRRPLTEGDGEVQYLKLAVHGGREEYVLRDLAWLVCVVLQPVLDQIEVAPRSRQCADVEIGVLVRGEPLLETFSLHVREPNLGSCCQGPITAPPCRHFVRFIS